MAQEAYNFAVPICNGSFKVLKSKVNSFSDLDQHVQRKLQAGWNIRQKYRIDTKDGAWIDDDSFDNCNVNEFIIKFPSMNGNNNNSNNSNGNNESWLTSKVHSTLDGANRAINNIKGMMNSGNNNNNNESHLLNDNDAKMADEMNMAALEEQLRAKEESFNESMIKDTIFDKNVENICYDMQIQSFITKLYPNIGKLWKYNPSGLLKYLSSMNGLTYVKATKGMNIMESDNDSDNCVSKYQKSLQNELHQILPGELNSKLKKEAQDIFYDKHCKAVNVNNFWPKANSGAMQRTIELKESRKYNENISIGNKNNDSVLYNITWHMRGILMVSDEVRANKYGEKLYITTCKSEAVEFKLVLLNELICKSINSQLINEQMMQEAKIHLDSLTAVVDTNALSWDDI